MTEIIPTKDLSPEASMRGDNTHIVKCSGVGQHRHYAVCLHFLHQKETEQLNEGIFMDCQHALRHEKCDAVGMRDEELAAGKALYYDKRPPVKVVKTMAVNPPRIRVDKTSDSYKRGWNQVGGKKSRDIDVNAPKPMKPFAPKPKPVDEDVIVEMNAAAIVNTIQKEEKKAPKTAHPSPEPGESPLEYAKRLKKLRS